MLSLPVPSECFKGQPATGHIGEHRGRIEQNQTAERNALNVAEFAAHLFAENFLRFRTSKGNDHDGMVFRFAEYVKPNGPLRSLRVRRPRLRS